MKAYLKNYRQAPRKTRLVANLIKGKNIQVARAELRFLAKKAGTPILKLLNSAVANAKTAGETDLANLFIKDIRVDKGLVLKRSQPRSRGMANPIHKHSSHITLVLQERGKLKT